jgi:putative flippase GtrA
VNSFSRYLLVQICAYGIDLGVFVLLIMLPGVGPIVANIISKIATGIFSFVAHRRFTFELPSERDNSYEAARYFLLLGINVPVSSLALSIMLRIFPSEVVAKIVSDGICFLANYWISKKYVFTSDAASAREGRERR